MFKNVFYRRGTSTSSVQDWHCILTYLCFLLFSFSIFHYIYISKTSKGKITEIELDHWTSDTDYTAHTVPVHVTLCVLTALKIMQLNSNWFWLSAHWSLVCSSCFHYHGAPVGSCECQQPICSACRAAFHISSHFTLLVAESFYFVLFFSSPRCFFMASLQRAGLSSEW